MIELYKLLQILGLSLDMVGILMIFFNSPINDSATYIYAAGEKFLKDKRRNRNLRIGLFALLLGLGVQIAGILLQ